MNGLLSSFESDARMTTGVVVRAVGGPRGVDRAQGTSQPGATDPSGRMISTPIVRGTDGVELSGAVAGATSTGTDLGAARDQREGVGTGRDGRGVGTAGRDGAEEERANTLGPDDGLTEDERAQVAELQKGDQQIKAHEQAHVAAAGSLFRGGPYYEYTTGPDGKRYAVAGRVDIDTSEGDSPSETIERAQQIKRAALAPADPSSQDRAVAAEAAQMESRARAEMAEEQRAAQGVDAGMTGGVSGGVSGAEGSGEMTGGSDSGLNSSAAFYDAYGKPGSAVGATLDVIG